MANVFSNTISTRVSSQLPQYVTQQYPLLVEFLQNYYEFMEQANTSEGTINQLYNLLDNRLVDTADSQFLQFMANDFLPYFPQETALNIRKLLKQATHFYQTKGSENSLLFLFRVLYNLTAEVYYPKQNVLKLSAGKWQLPQALKLLVSPDVANFDIRQLVARLGQGSVSNATCTIESATLSIDETLKIEFIELFISNLTKPFTPGESLIVNCVLNPEGQPIIFNEPIIGQVSEILINPQAQGLLYVGTQYFPNGAISYPGNPVSIIGGLANSANSIEAVAFVNTVTEGSVTSVFPQAGGYGFRDYPNTILTFVNAPTDNTGSGANAIVDAITNTSNLILNTDSIEFKFNVQLGSANYAFDNVASANLSTTFANAFSYTTITVGSISHITLKSGGFGYTQVPTVVPKSYFDSDFSLDEMAIYNANSNINTFNQWINSRPLVASLGRIVVVDIQNGGTGYSNVTDAIYLANAYGQNFTSTFITGAGGTITQVLITNTGSGYSTPKPSVYVANSANSHNVSAGVGAVMTAHGDNEDYILDVSVSQIGQIIDFRFNTRGFDYIETPVVSLRNEDVVIHPIPDDDFFVQTEVVFQGANINAASFVAHVDGYDRANSILRLYDYTGRINVTQNLIGANFNSSPISANVYGNGKAKANAQFLGGLIDFPGYWIDTSGFLSADQFLQDSTIYQNYSYVVKVEKPLAAYEDTLMKIVHPAGTKMLGIYTITDKTNDGVGTDFIPVMFGNTAIEAGNVSVTATDHFPNGAANVVGHGTNFTHEAHPDDFITIDTGNRQQVKKILGVVNDTNLIVESNTYYLANDLVSTFSGSVRLKTKSATTDLIINDVILLNIAGNGITALVVNTDQGTGNINTNVTFGVNSSNNYFAVLPNTTNVVYEIWTTQ